MDAPKYLFAVRYPMTFPLLMIIGGVLEYLLKGEYELYSLPKVPYLFQMELELYSLPYLP